MDNLFNHQYDQLDQPYPNIHGLNSLIFNGRIAEQAKDTIVAQKMTIECKQSEININDHTIEELRLKNNELKKILNSYESQIECFFVVIVNHERIDEFRKIKNERDLSNKKELKDSLVKFYNRTNELKNQRKEIDKNHG